MSTAENIFGKMRGRYDEMLARRAVKQLREDTLDKLWSLSDEDLKWLIEAHDDRNKTLSHPLSMNMREPGALTSSKPIDTSGTE